MLKLIYASRFGPIFPDAVAVINQFQGHHDKLTYHVEIYADKQFMEQDKRPVERMHFTMDTPVGVDIRTAMLLDLKSRPGFETATEDTDDNT